MEHTKKLMLVPEQRFQNFVQVQLSTLDKQMHTILQRKNITDEEKATLYLQILQKFVNFPYPSKNPDIMETVDTKQENYQNQSTDTVEDKINTLTSLSPKEHVITRPKEETSVDTIEEEIGSIAPVKCKNIPKKILNFIQQNQGEIYWTPDKELIVDGKIIRNTNIINLITHLVRDRKKKPFGFEFLTKF
ncbi:uncharacterized protein TNCV_3897521 [Trichonephila clavipes]|nr:uncharacterized protein TNCV_3636201 [Trichonephila clavipes]GFW04700.1 uncharacterized protein TNCV_3897521 [Trichonephila clavipes]